MSRWYPQQVCNGGNSCTLFCDDATGEPINFESKCQMHQALSDGGMADADLWTQIQLDSKHFAAAIAALHAAGADAFVLFKADRTIEVTANGVGGIAQRIALRVAIAAAIGKDPVIARLALGGKANAPALSVIGNG